MEAVGKAAIKSDLIFIKNFLFAQKKRRPNCFFKA